MDRYTEAVTVGIEISSFCWAFGLSKRTLYYWKHDLSAEGKVQKRDRKKSQTPANKLTTAERKEVEKALLQPTWSDLSPREIYYLMLDNENRVIASISTFYRVARDCSLLAYRYKSAKQGLTLNRDKPVLVATGSNQVWSWDVTQISTTRKTERFYLYVIMDIWSRFVVGWTLEEHEKSSIAIQLWKDALESQLITGKGLVNHKDNGAIMTSGDMIKFVRDAEMVDSYSRAGVSDDNPFSESLFRTIKYFRDFPERIESLATGREYFNKYFSDYNFCHRHSGIQFLVPASRHHGEELTILNKRNLVLQAFAKKKSHRFSSKQKVFKPIVEVTIN